MTQALYFGDTLQDNYDKINQVWLKTEKREVNNQIMMSLSLILAIIKLQFQWKRKYQYLNREKEKSILRFLNKISDYYMINLKNFLIEKILKRKQQAIIQ